MARESDEVETLYKILHDLTKFTKFLLHENRTLRKERRTLRKERK
jgi:hypothetical protein